MDSTLPPLSCFREKTSSASCVFNCTFNIRNAARCNAADTFNYKCEIHCPEWSSSEQSPAVRSTLELERLPTGEICFERWQDPLVNHLESGDNPEVTALPREISEDSVKIAYGAKRASEESNREGDIGTSMVSTKRKRKRDRERFGEAALAVRAEQCLYKYENCATEI